MSTPDAAGPDGPRGTPLEQVRGLLATSTQHLLGATMGVEEQDWRGPSRLPRWTRGHVATHVARNAEAIGRLALWASTGEPQMMYASADQRDADIAAGAARPGLELQVDLDTTADALADAFARLAEGDRWDTPVEVRGTDVPARMLPLMRLSEVALHHVDLDVGTALTDLDPEVLGWLLEFVAYRLQRRADYPALEIRTDTGHQAALGEATDSPRVVGGPDAAVLGWLTGRSGPDGLTGTDGIELPPFA